MAQAGKPIYLVANWKSNKTWAETEVFLQSFRGFREEGRVNNIICPPLPYLKPAVDLVNNLHLPIKLGTQDISPFPFGAYTGATSAQMLMGMAKYAIVGHSERRRYFHETNQEIANKIDQCLAVEITPILCVDEPYLRAQINAIPKEQLKKVVVAYEPLEAIGSGKPADPGHTQKVAEQILETSEVEIPVLYGGSVTAETINDFLDQPLIQGALVGGASLKVDSWKAIVQQAARIT